MATLQQIEEEVNKIKDRNQNLEDSVLAIKARNKRVETEKAWETSWSRRIMIALMTYLVISIFFFFAGNTEPLEDAIVPSIAFVLSTLSGPFIKKLWLKHIHKG